MSDAETLHTLSVDAPQAGMRLDKWLAEALPELSRSRLKALIEDGRLASGSEIVADPSRKVRAGEHYRLSIPAPAPARPQPEQIALCVVYEDDQLIVVDKPAGMVVHPAPGNTGATLVNALLHHCGASLSGIGGERRPGIVHRLDKDTSGLLVAAKTDIAHHSLSAQFAAHTVTRAYQALCWGVPTPASGEVAGNIGRNPGDRKKMALVRRGGKTALTRYRILRRFGDLAALLECRLATGRTHQIRVHLAAIGHPLVGDPAYGRRRRSATPRMSAAEAALVAFPRQALHAGLLGFTHPTTGEGLLFESDIPRDFNELLSHMNEM